MPPIRGDIPKAEDMSPESICLRMLSFANSQSKRHEVLEKISKVDREISNLEEAIQQLKLKEKLLVAACQSDENIDDDDDDDDERSAMKPKNQSFAQRIYEENRRKVQASHKALEKLGSGIKCDFPLYNRPLDTPAYHENKKKHLLFKKRLIQFLGKDKKEREAYEKHLTETYSQLWQEWHRKVEKIESSAERKAKNAKYREAFEKEFPELRKKREYRERLRRIGARTRSEEAMDSLQEQKMEFEKMKLNAVMPPLLQDARQRRYCYINNNGKIEDLSEEYKQRQLLNLWSREETEIFKEKFLQHPKNFGLIASYLERKSICDCVQYYYQSKKEENYKLLLRKSRLRTRSRRNSQGKVNNPSGVSASKSNATGGIDSTLSSPPQTERVQRRKQTPSTPNKTTSSHPAQVCDTLTVKSSADENNNPSPLLQPMPTAPPYEPIDDTDDIPAPIMIGWVIYDEFVQD